MAANGPLSQLWAGTWGLKNKDLSSRGYSEGATSGEGPSSLHMGTVLLPVFFSELLLHIPCCTCLPTRPIMYHTCCPNVSHMAQLSLPGRDTPACP